MNEKIRELAKQVGTQSRDWDQVITCASVMVRERFGIK